MNDYATYVKDFFAPRNTTIARTEPLAVEEEIDLIAAAQAGDDDAKMRLLEQYAPAIRSAYFSFIRRLPKEERPRIKQDTQAEALAAFFESLNTHDAEKSPRLAGRLGARLRKALTDLSVYDTPFDISESSMSRFYRVLRDNDGEVDLAREALAADTEDRYHMSVRNFDEVLAVVRETESLSRVADDNGGDDDREEMHGLDQAVQAPYEAVEDRMMVDLAFEALDDEERRVVEVLYGFETLEDVDPGEYDKRAGAALAVSMSTAAPHLALSRQKVQRTHAAALDKMRECLQVAHLEG